MDSKPIRTVAVIVGVLVFMVFLDKYIKVVPDYVLRTWLYFCCAFGIGAGCYYFGWFVKRKQRITAAIVVFVPIANLVATLIMEFEPEFIKPFLQHPFWMWEGWVWAGAGSLILSVFVFEFSQADQRVDRPIFTWFQTVLFGAFISASLANNLLYLKDELYLTQVGFTKLLPHLISSTSMVIAVIFVMYITAKKVRGESVLQQAKEFI